MAPATRKLEPHLRELKILPPLVPFFSNVTGGRVDDPEAIREGLIRQVESPVRWKDILKLLADDGVTGALELGPGRVLQGLMRGVRKDIEVLPAGTSSDMDALKDLFAVPAS
jgi:[acyl-carrier-protein] S-malonyltransferase